MLHVSIYNKTREDIYNNKITRLKEKNIEIIRSCEKREMSGSNLSIASVALVFGPIAKSTIVSAAVAFGSWSFVAFVATSSTPKCFASSAIWPTCSTCAVGRPSSIVVLAAAVATVATDGFVVVAAAAAFAVAVVAAEIACRFGSSSCGPGR